jgi:hypothetical protein
MVAVTPRAFSINAGGPFDHLVHKFHLLAPGGMIRVGWIVVVAWVPLVLGSTLRVLFGMPVNPLVLDISVHARFLVGAPLLLISAALLEPQCRGAIRMLYEGKFADAKALDRVVDRGERLRASSWIEAALVVIALAIGQLGLWGVIGPTGVFAGIADRPEWSVARFWYGIVSLPLLLFLMLRWLWRWGVWTYMLAQFARLPLAATATHPDRSAGLAFFAWPTGGFHYFVTGFTSVLAGAWGTQLLDHRITVPSLGPTVLALLVIAFAVGYVPLLLFSGHLYRARRRALLSHGLFALSYVRQFDTKWIDDGTESPLGAQDIQALNDLGGAYQVVVTTRTTVFDLMRLKNLAIAVILPLVPLFLTVVPLDKVVGRLGHALIGVLGM